MSSIGWDKAQKALRSTVVSGSGFPDGSVIWSQQSKGRPSDPWITLNITGIRPVGGTQTSQIANPLVISAPVGRVDVAPSNSFAVPSHGLSTGDGPVQVNATIALPAGLLPLTNYWIIVLGPSTIQLSASYLGAMAFVPVPVTLTGPGSGVITIASTSSTTRQGQDIKRFTRGPRLATMTVQCFATMSFGVTDAIAVVGDVMATFKVPSFRNALNVAGVGISRTRQLRSTGMMVNSTSFEPRAIGEVDFFLASELVDYVGYISEVDITGKVDTGSVIKTTFNQVVLSGAASTTSGTGSPVSRFTFTANSVNDTYTVVLPVIRSNLNFVASVVSGEFSNGYPGWLYAPVSQNTLNTVQLRCGAPLAIGDRVVFDVEDFT